jgi:hypothetical protein
MIKDIKNIIMEEPAKIDDILEYEQDNGILLPEVYKDLLSITNGMSIGGGIKIYGIYEIEERNLTWEIEKYAKEYVAIGDDGGGNIFLMQKKDKCDTVIVVDSVDLNPEDINIATYNFEKWIKSGCQDEENTKKQIYDFCKIVLICMPKNGIKDLIKLKTEYGLNTSSSDLIKAIKLIPFELVKEYPYGKAIKIKEKLKIDFIEIVPIIR